MTSKILNTTCSNGDLDKIQELLSSDWKPSQYELDKALQAACWGGHATITGLLLSNGARITDQAFMGACRNEDLSIFQEFLNHGWDINSTEFEGEPALRLLVGDEACIRWCLEHGADPNLENDQGVTPLATAALQPSIAPLELLITHGARLDPEALYSALNRRGNGGIPVMAYLIDQGIDINAPIQGWESPLHYAVWHSGPPDRVQLLIEKGADRSKKDRFGKTPVEVAKSRMTRTKDAMKVYEILSE